MRSASFLVAALAMSACGGTTSNGGNSFGGTFSIQGAPHVGGYTECVAAGLVGNGMTLTCDGVGSCSSDPATGCGLVVSLPATAGTFHCDNGQASVTLYDPGLPANATGLHSAGAGCQPTETAPAGEPNPSCPTDAMGCNRLVGDCTVNITSIKTMDGSNAYGHFSGSVSATLFASYMNVDCNGQGPDSLQGTGQMLSINVSGAW